MSPVVSGYLVVSGSKKDGISVEEDGCSRRRRRLPWLDTDLPQTGSGELGPVQTGPCPMSKATTPYLITRGVQGECTGLV